MRKLLFTSAAVIGLTFGAGIANATGGGPPSCNSRCSVDEVVAAALGVNIGGVYGMNFGQNADATAGMAGSIRDNQGVTQANQNAGAGALQQNAVALAAIEGCGTDCVDVNLAATVAAAVNVGYVDGWNSECGCHNDATAAMAGSIRGNVGLTQVQQNAGAGALQQNAIAVGYVGTSR